jgi:hypothetical protein
LEYVECQSLQLKVDYSVYAMFPSMLSYMLEVPGGTQSGAEASYQEKKAVLDKHRSTLENSLVAQRSIVP